MPARRFVIGDIHGCACTLRTLVEDRLAISRGDELYLLGDLIDRGPDSRGVLDFIFELRKRGISVMSVKGNHEAMCLLAGDDLRYLEMWLANGGIATLRSFDAEGPNEIHRQYIYLLRSLPNYILLDDFVLVHASLNFDLADPFGDIEAMLWLRECSVDSARIDGRRLVSGHTAVTREQLEKSLKTDRILLDNGCVFAGRPGMGSLAALELNSMTVTYQENIDK